MEKLKESDPFTGGKMLINEFTVTAIFRRICDSPNKQYHCTLQLSRLANKKKG